MIWEHLYSDLIATTRGEYSGYVELIPDDNGKYGWEILKDAVLWDEGRSASPDTAKRAVERRLA